jgi:hypothetical protein
VKRAEDIDLVRAAPQLIPPVQGITDARVVSDIGLREITTYVLLLLFVLATAASYTLIFLWGAGKMKFPEAFIHWLGAATIGQTASLLLIIIKSLFPGTGSGNSQTQKK